MATSGAMYGAGPSDETQRLRAELARLERERGEAVGMVQLLQGKLHEAEEETFELRANMVTVEAEAQFASRQQSEALGKQVASLASKLSFVTEQLKNAERVKLRAVRELDELRQRQMLEQKRLEAEKRLLATKKRKHESAVLLAASQSLRMSQLDAASPPVVVSPPVASRGSGSGVAGMTERAAVEPRSPRERLAAENAELVATLMDTASRDLLVLFKGSSEAAVAGEDPTGDGDGMDDGSPSNGRSEPQSSMQSYASEAAKGSQYQSAAGESAVSQSVFSQIAGHAHAQVKASLLNFAKEANLTQAAYVNERAKDLHDALASMIYGHETALALAPVIVRYLTAPSDLDTTVLCSVLRMLYLVIVHSECFQEFLLLASSSESDPGPAVGSGMASSRHPRISFSGLQFASLDEYLASKKDDKLASREVLASQTHEQQLADRMQMRAKLLSALCRVIQNNANEPRILDCGLSVLALWVDLGVVHRAPHADFKALVASNLIQEIVLAPKGISVKHKTRAVNVLTELVHFNATFPEIEASVRRTLFFNRCARILGGIVPTAHVISASGASVHSAQEEAKSDLRALQHSIIRLFLAIVITYPSMGIRFVLESTHGHGNDDDHDLSVIYYLAQLLNRETFDARTLGLDALDEVLQSAQRLRLIQDAFTLLSLLVRYVDLGRELGSPHHEYSFLSVLYLLSSSKFDLPKNNTISKTSAALVALMQPTQTEASSS